MACGPQLDPYDYYPSFFHNTIQDNNGYKSFYFNGMLFLNDDSDQLNEADINANEWHTYLGKTVSVNDIKKAMYSFDGHTDSLLLLKYLKPNSARPDSLRKNSFLKKLVSGRYNDALNYFRFAKTAEPFAALNYNDNWKPVPRDDKKLRALSATALKSALFAKSQFIRLRYFYQAQRLLFYSNNKRESAVLYDKYIAGSASKSHVTGWALSLRAGSELYTGNKVKAAYLFSKVFAWCPERRIQSFYGFNRINEPQASIIKFAKTTDEKAFIYAISGFHKPRVDLTALEQVYKVQPRSPLLKVLLVREINKIEESYLSKKLDKTAHHNPYNYLQPYVGEDSTVKKQRAYIPKLMAFCSRLAHEGRYVEPAVGNLAAAYLNWIQGKAQQGLDELTRINDQKLDIKLNDQKQMVTLLLQAQKITRLDTIAVQELVPALSWLDKKVKWEARYIKPDKLDYGWSAQYSNKPYSVSARDFYSLILAPAYLKQKDTVMAALAMLKGDQTIPADRSYQGPAPGFNMPDFMQRKLRSHDIARLITVTKNPAKTPYIKLLTSEINRKLSYDLYDILGTAYLREHKYANAVKAFRKIPASVSKHTPNDGWPKSEYRSNPFINPGAHSANAAGYTKPMFARKMAQLQKLIKTDSKQAAKYYYQLALGLYNTSCYGRSWYLVAYTRTSYDNGREATEYYDADFLTTANAEKYFIKARKASNNNDFKARCTFMAARCKRNQVENHGYKYDESKPKQNDIARARFDYSLIHNPYFAEMKKKYSNTAYYKQAVSECVYLQDFLSAQTPLPVQKQKVIVQ